MVTAGETDIATAVRERTWVVTGASGFIGRRLVARLRTDRANVRVWSRHDERPVDLLDNTAVARAFADDAPDVVMHLAASGVSARRVHDASVIGENVVMTAHLIATIGASGRKTTLVSAGTMAEYADLGRALREDDPCVPGSAYGIGKLAASHYALAYAPVHGVPCRVARLFGVYGPGEPPDRLFPTLRRELGAGRVVPLSDGAQRRDFIHVDDACDALMRIALADATDAPVVNVGTGIAVAVRDVCRWLADAMGRDPALLAFGGRERSAGDRDLLLADTTQLRRLTGWVPEQRLRPQADLIALMEGSA